MGSSVTQRFLETTIDLACFEGSGLNDIFHLKAQLDIRCRSSLSIAESLSSSFKTENIDVASVNIFILDWIPSRISLIKVRKSSVPNIEPWGTRANISFQFEVWLLSTTLWNLFDKKLFIRVKGGPFIPYDLSLNNNPSCQTLSKALHMSRKTALVYNDGIASKLE